jgi:hypothetical protein
MQINIPYIMTQGSEKDYRAENSGIRLSVVQLPHAFLVFTLLISSSHAI